MAKTTKAKPGKSITKTKPKTAEGSLDAVFEDLVTILKRHVPPFSTKVPLVVKNKKAFQITVPKPVVIPGSYGGKPVPIQLAAVIVQTGYVGLYVMCIYMNPAAKDKLPNLKKLLKGKSCFHVKKLDDILKQEVEEALEIGTAEYKKRGWV
jgi:hypothetical protein